MTLGLSAIFLPEIADPVFNLSMHRALSIAAVFVVAACCQAQSWMLKAPYEAKAKFVWKVTVNANLSGMEVEATMKQHLDIESRDDKQVKGKSAWTEVAVNGQEQPDDQDPWAVVLNTNGSIVSANDSLDYGRMLVPAVFVYPDKEVKVGDKWTVKFKPAKDAQEVTSDYEVVEMTKVGEFELDIKNWVVPMADGMPAFDAKVKGDLVKE
jgi:hypothetical protein